MLTEIWKRCNAIEECYEFMLAYAAQGLPTDEGNQKGGQIREFLYRAVKALAGLAENCATAVKEEGLEPAERYPAFFAVLDRDARDSLAAIELVLAQPAVSSQLIDNLNASIHLRALLTDLFLCWRDPEDATHTGSAAGHELRLAQIVKRRPRRFLMVGKQEPHD